MTRLKFGQDGRIFFKDVSEDEYDSEGFGAFDNSVVWDAGKLVRDDFDTKGAEFARGVFVACMMLNGIHAVFTN